MECLHPLQIKNPRPTEKNPYTYILVPCGKCINCKEKRHRDWTTRLILEREKSTYSYFCCLTYDDEHLPRSEAGDPTLVPKHLQDYIKRVRAALPNDKVRYFACGEYGTSDLGTHRGHYHITWFNFPPDKLEILQEKWPFGYVSYDGELGIGACHYIADYMLKAEDYVCKEGQCKPFIRMSTKPAIGHEFLTPAMQKYLKTHEDLYVVINGQKRPLPRYYRKKLGIEGSCDFHLLSDYKEKYGEEEGYRQYSGIEADLNRRNQKIRRLKGKL